MSAPADELTTSERTFAVRVVRRRTKARGMRGAFDRYSMARKATNVTADKPSGSAAKIVAAMPIGTFTNMTDRHPNAAVRIPPAIEPAANPADRIETRTPNARFLSFPSGKVAARIAKAVAVVIAAATP